MSKAIQPIAIIHSLFKEKFSIPRCEDALKENIIEVLSLDPRPRFHKDGHKQYGSRLGNVDVHWEVKDGVAQVFEIT